MDGYIKLWRKCLDKGWLQNHKLWVFWTWCLLKASHREFDAIVGLQIVHIMPGQFIFGLKKASAETKLTISEIRRMITFMKTNGNITIKTTNKFSVITVVNWECYQGDELENSNQTSKQRANKEQHTRMIRIKEKVLSTSVDNTKKKVCEFSLPEIIDPLVWDEFLSMRVRIKKPMTEFAKKLCVEKLIKIKAETGDEPDDVLKQSIENSWNGVFPLKKEGSDKFGRAGKGFVPYGQKSSVPKSRHEQEIDDDIAAIYERRRQRLENKSAAGQAQKNAAANYADSEPGRDRGHD